MESAVLQLEKVVSRAPNTLEVVWAGQSYKLETLKEYYKDQLGETLL